jgi:sec-independent protein translocase protein TatA
MLFGWLNGWEIVMILVLALVMFGAKKLPELAKGLGQGIKEFKKASRDVQDEIQSAMNTDPEPPAPPVKKLPETASVEPSAAVPQSSTEQKA